MKTRIAFLAVTALICNLPAQSPSSQGDAKRAITPEDYSKWESLGTSRLSPDGSWLAYQVSKVDGESVLKVLMLATPSNDDFPYGSNPVFSADSKWLAFRIGMSEDEREKLQAASKPVRNKMGLHDLTTGGTEEFENVASFGFSDDGRYLTMRRYPVTGRESGGADLVVRVLQSGTDTNFGNVASSAWADDSSLLAMVIDAEGKAGNGVQLFDPDSGVLKTLESNGASYKSLIWREDGDDLAVLRETSYDEDDDEDPSHVVVTWRGLDGDSSRKKAFDHRNHESFPEGMRVVDFAGLRWAEEDGVVFFGIAPWDNPPADKEDEGDAEEGEGEEEEADEGGEQEKDGDRKPTTLRESLEEPSNVEVWHIQDVDIIPRQKRTENQDRRENFLAAWWIEDNSFVELGNELTESVTLLEGEKRALGSDNTPYDVERMFGPTMLDVYVIDVKTGERERVLERVKYRYGSSPDGRHVPYVRNNSIWLYDVETGAHRNLTQDVPTHFINQEVSNLSDEKPPYGIAAWTEDSKNVLLYDRYDIWMLPVEGGEAVRLTRGAENSVRHRRIMLDPEEDRHISPDRPVYLSLYGDWDKKSGYARMMLGEAPEKLLWRDKNVGRLAKAEDAPVLTFVEQAFDDSPDIFVTGPDLVEGRQVSHTNEFQEDYLWGHGELINYTNVHGQELQGALHYPAGWEEGKKYPMIVLIYELRSQNLHRYTTPTERSPYNPTVMSAEGYFVFQPDIVYRPQNPGLSSVECVVPAVKAVIATGLVEEDSIGLMGHSWGGYQTAFLVTQTDVFAAGVAGAPLTNMMSMSVSIYWNSGNTDAQIFHESQGRMDQPFWKDVSRYIDNSPVFNIDSMNTPLLMTFGTEDGAVEYNQGVEMYNTARLAQKPLVMLSYPGENHGLANESNQVDYHYRIVEWFAHYLKGEEPAKWITDGMPWIERQKEIERLKKKGK